MESAFPPEDADEVVLGAIHASDAVHEDTEEELRGVDPVVRRRIQDWAKRLIDLSRRNRLLYYRPTKRTTLRLVAPDAIHVAETVLAGGAWRFYEPPGEEAGGPAASVDEALTAKPPRPRELVTHHADPKELERSLEVISRRARAEFQDRGTHVLQLGWGMVHWIDDRSNEPVRSPLLLIPALLSRASIKEQWTLRPADDDPFLNPALRVKLHSDFGLQLPEVADFTDVRLSELADSITEALPSGWQVESDAVLGIFGFAKEAMYRDLVDHIALVAADSQVQTLAHGEPMGEMRDALGITVPGGAELDVVQDPGTSYSVLDADSSQRESIEAAVAGLSFVMHGPPGTGKSQTIANTIAEFIGRGRSVLFVSEKIAALEVVANRLAEVGLRDMILELHSHKASRKEVAVELARVLDEDLVPRPELPTAEIELLRRSRTHLNAYVAALHELRQPLGRSVRSVLSDLASMGGVRALPSPKVDAREATAGDFLQIEALIGRMAASWAPKDPTVSFTWHNTAMQRYAASDRVRVTDTLSTAKVAITRVSALEVGMRAVLGLGAPTSEDDREAIHHMGPLLASRVDVPRAWLTDRDIEEQKRRLQQWKTLTLERDQLLQPLLREYGAAWDKLDASQAGPTSSASQRLAGLLGVEELDSVAGISRLGALAAAAEGLRSAVSGAVGLFRQASERLGLRPRLTRLADLDLVVEACELSQSRHRPPAAWLSRPRREEAESFVEQYGELYTSYQEANSRLSRDYDLTLLEAVDLPPLLARLESQYGRWWSILRPSHRADRRLLRTVRRDHELPPESVEDIRAISALRDKRAAVERIDQLEQRVLGPLAAGVDTNVVEASVALASAVRLAAIDELIVDWDCLADTTTHGTPYSAEIERLGDRIKALAADVAAAINELASASQARLDAWLAASPEDVVKSTHAIEETARLLLSILGRIELSRSTPVPDVRTAIAELERRGEVEGRDADLHQESAELASLFGPRFQGWLTDWPSLEARLDWVVQLRAIYGGGPVPDALADAIQSEAGAELPFDDYKVAWVKSQLVV